MTKTSLKPLKIPTQARSWATYHAILEATTYILMEQGYDSFTTNHVAERAGVSIASLYQYFPNKESLVATLHTDHAKQTRQKINDILNNAGDCSTVTMIDLFVDAMVESHCENPELHRVFQEEIPRLLKTSILEEGNDQFLETIALITKNANLPTIAQKNIAWTIRILTHSIVHHGIIDRREDLLSGRMSAELKIMLRKLLL